MPSLVDIDPACGSVDVDENVKISSDCEKFLQAKNVSMKSIHDLEDLFSDKSL